MAAVNRLKSLTIFIKMPCEEMSVKPTFTVPVLMQNVPSNPISTSQSSVKGESAAEVRQE